MATVDTKTKIAMTLAEMVNHNNIDNITVQKITDACGVSRQTFYYYFSDILDVAEYYAHYTADKIVADCGKCNSSQEIVKVIVEHLCRGAETAKKLFQSATGYRLCEIFLTATRTVIEKILLKKISSYPVTPSEVSVAIDFFTSGLLGICLQHGNASDGEIEDFSKKLYNLLEGSIKSLYNN
ncbi:MAG: TetR/AcrR family transcriptional regulator [Candidatus Coproplasma sp.]